MKKRLTLMTLAFISILGGAKAQELVKYDVSVCSEQVTSDNIGDIVGMANTYLTEHGHGTITGTITYDPATKTMTLDNVTANVTEAYNVLYFENGNYTLVVKGTNTLTSEVNSLSAWNSDVTITGGGTLTLNSTLGYAALDFFPAEGIHTLTLNEVTVDVQSGFLGGWNDNDLIINKATLKVKGEIYACHDIQITGAIISKPAGAEVVSDGSSCSIRVDGSIATDIEITADSRANPGLAFSAATATYNHSDATHSWPTLTNTHGVAVSYTSSNTSVATVNASTGVVTPVAEGVTTITATFAGDASYYPMTVKYTLSVTGKGQDPEISLTSTYALMADGTNRDLSKLVENPHSLPIEYEIDESTAGNASVDASGKVTANYGPTAIVLVKTPGNLDYGSRTMSFYIMIGSESEIQKVRCDANGDGDVTITDAVTVVNYILNH